MFISTWCYDISECDFCFLSLDCCSASDIIPECKPVCMNLPAVNGTDCSSESQKILLCAAGKYTSLHVNKLLVQFRPYNLCACVRALHGIACMTFQKNSAKIDEGDQ